MVDVKRIKVGDQILLRSRDVKTVTEVKHKDDDTFPVSVFLGTSYGMVAYTRDGFYWHDHEEDYRDILEIIPAETSEETPIDATRIKDTDLTDDAILAEMTGSGYVDIEDIDANRIEVISSVEGREYVRYLKDNERMFAILQDDNRTMKIFIKEDNE